MESPELLELLKPLEPPEPLEPLELPEPVDPSELLEPLVELYISIKFILYFMIFIPRNSLFCAVVQQNQFTHLR